MITTADASVAWTDDDRVNHKIRRNNVCKL